MMSLLLGIMGILLALCSATGHDDDAGVTNYVVEAHCF
jgi:hypothetical protein